MPRTPSTFTLVRRSSTICRAGTTPTSAVMRTSSISSHVSSSSRSRDSSPSSTEPTDDCERDRRSRSRTSRPAEGGGFSISGAGGGAGTARRRRRGDDRLRGLRRVPSRYPQLGFPRRLGRRNDLDRRRPARRRRGRTRSSQLISATTATKKTARTMMRIRVSMTVLSLSVRCAPQTTGPDVTLVAGLMRGRDVRPARARSGAGSPPRRHHRPAC